MSEEPRPNPEVVDVTMLWPFFERFRAWAGAQGFLVHTLPGGREESYVVVPGEELMRRVSQEMLREVDEEPPG